MEFFDVVGSQRACREFSDRPVPDDMVEQILRAATGAPSAMNHQPWVFVVVRDPEARHGLVSVARELWEGGGRDATVGRVPDALLDEVDRGFTTTLRDAPVLVVVAGDTEVAPVEQLGWSIYPAVQNLLLAATALGLGSALTTMATFRPADLQGIVDLPAPLVPMAMVPVGWPAARLGKPRRIPVGEKAFRDRYGNRW